MTNKPNMSKKTYLPIIGLEVHVELETNSKMFCGCSADYFGHEPNTHCCPVCLGLPGALPVPNKKAVEWCVMLGLALNCQIPEVSKFDRKNYFYPDLPKGYQISQYDNPLCINGWVKMKNKQSLISDEIEKRKMKNDNEKSKNDAGKTVRIRRVHMEEDTGKLIHTKERTLIDFNRSGVPLVEIVTEPDIHSAQEAKVFLQKLQQIIRYLGISDCDMEKGSMRCEPNISVREIKNQKSSFGKLRIMLSKVEASKIKTNDELPPYKVEIKNINSFKFVEKAIAYEIGRQEELLSREGFVRQETRGFDPQKGVTLPQRGKEAAADYRYFPEPDIPPIRINKLQISNIKLQIPELPDKKLSRFIKEYGLSEYDTGILTETRETADYYEEVVRKAQTLDSGNLEDSRNLGWIKTIANWIINKKVDIDKVLPKELVKMIVQKSQIRNISQEELEKAVVKVLTDNPKAVGDYKSGKAQALMFLVGQVMKQVKGSADPKLIAKLLNEKIKKKNEK